MANNTIRRDVFRRRIQAGKVELRCRYHYTDDYAWDAAVNFGKDDEFKIAVWDDFKFDRDENIEDWRDEDVRYRQERAQHRHELDEKYGSGQYILVDSGDLNTGSGRVYWQDQDQGLATFAIHSNLVFAARISK